MQKLLGESGLQVSLGLPHSLRSIADLFDVIAEKIDSKNWQHQRDRLNRGIIRVLDMQENLHADLRCFLQRGGVLLEKAQNLKSVEIIALQMQYQLTLNPEFITGESSHDVELMNFYLSFRTYSVLEIIQLTAELLRSIDHKSTLNICSISNKSE